MVNRSMGRDDLHPFILASPVLEKMRSSLPLLGLPAGLQELGFIRAAVSSFQHSGLQQFRLLVSVAGDVHGEEHRRAEIRQRSRRPP